MLSCGLRNLEPSLLFNRQHKCQRIFKYTLGKRQRQFKISIFYFYMIVLFQYLWDSVWQTSYGSEQIITSFLDRVCHHHIPSSALNYSSAPLQGSTMHFSGLHQPFLSQYCWSIFMTIAEVSMRNLFKIAKSVWNCTKNCPNQWNIICSCHTFYHNCG